MSLRSHHAVCIAALLAACAGNPARALAAESDADSTTFAPAAELDVVSRYVWRAISYSEGVVLQPSVGFSAGALELGVWANIDPSLPGSSRVSEVDYSAAWSFPLGHVEVTPGVVLYTYPGLADGGTGELQIELRQALPGGWSAVIRSSADVFDYRGATFTAAGFDREWSFESGGSLSLSTQFGRCSQKFSDAYLPGAPPLTLVGASASWTVAVGRGWAVRPHVDWLEAMDGEARAILPSHVPFTVGVALGRL